MPIYCKLIKMNEYQKGPGYKDVVIYFFYYLKKQTII